MAITMSFNCPNYSGILFNKGNTRTPLLSAIAPRRKVSSSVEFALGQEFTTAEGEQPNISEQASLTAPEPTTVTRTQGTNVTQIFQYAYGVSDAKMSNMGTLSGLNVANQTANPINELDFQRARTIDKMRNDIEFTLIQGTYNKAESDSTVNKTRGLNAAITTNAIDMETKPMGLWAIAGAMEQMRDGNAPIEGLTFWCGSKAYLQLQADAIKNGLTIVPASRNENGIKIDTVLTPFGYVGLRLGEHLPTNTAFLLNLPMLSLVEMIVPGKGNFYDEVLAKTGAGEKHQIFGQLGLDYGAEWYHAKFTNIAPDFTAPVAGRTVEVINTPAAG